MFQNLLKKELKELLNLYSLLFVTILAVVYGLLGQGIEKTAESVPRHPTVALINRDTGRLAQIVETFFKNSAHVVYNGDDEERALETLKSSKGIAVIVVPRDFSTSILSDRKGRLEITWLIKGTSVMDTAGIDALNRQFEKLEKTIIRSLLEGEHGGMSPELLLDPLELRERTMIRDFNVQGPPSLVIGWIQSRSVMMPVLVVMLIMISGTTVITSMGMEKENRTLETLMTLPVNRNYIVLSKIVASAITGLILASIYMVGIIFYMRPLSFQLPEEMKSVFSMSELDYLLLGLSLFFALMAGLSFFMVLASFARDYRSSQTLSFPVTMLAVIPMLLTMFKDYTNLSVPLKILLFSIPFSHPMIAMKELMLDDQRLVIWGILYSAAFSAGFTLLSTRIYNSERILLGRTSLKKRGSRSILHSMLRNSKKT